MKWSKILGFGALIWIIIFVLISVFVAYDYMPGWLSYVFAIIGIALAIWFAGFLNIQKASSALTVGIIWVVLFLVLDYLISRQFASDMFSSWLYWVNYLLILLAPMVRIKKSAMPMV